MDFQPGTLLESPFIAELVRIGTMAFAAAALVVVGGVLACVARECRCLSRSSRLRDDASGAGSSAHATLASSR